jgi:hypothetical protein
VYRLWERRSSGATEQNTLATPQPADTSTIGAWFAQANLVSGAMIR